MYQLTICVASFGLKTPQVDSQGHALMLDHACVRACMCVRARVERGCIGWWGRYETKKKKKTLE